MLEIIEDLIDHLESTIYIGNFPDNASDNICTLYNTSGRPSQKTFQGATIIRNPSFQVRVRDASYQNGLARCNAIVEALDGSNTATATYRLLLIELENDIMDIGKDSKNRSEFTINFKYLSKKL